jgi:DNA (cytosine-5)-methyltransferase 3A
VKMKKEWVDVISEQLWVGPIEINSSLVSAQNRKRLYWTNIPWITQPQDKWILLKDILEDNVDEKYYLTEKQYKMIDNRKWFEKPLENIKTWEDKIGTLTTHVAKMSNSIKLVRDIRRVGWMYGQTTRRWIYDKSGVAPTITASMWMGGWHVPMIIQKVWDRDKNNWWVHIDKSYCLPANPMSDRWQMVVEWMGIRKLTPIECERLQTMPDNYTEWVSDTQRYKMLGNWWTCDVISHIFSFLPKE